MISFELATPRTESEAVELLNDHEGQTAVLAGGIDLIPLLKRDLIAPKRVVDLKRVAGMSGVEQAEDGVVIGALATLDELAKHPLMAGYPSVQQVIAATHSIQIQARGTIAGDLCHLPNCWYFRNGYGLLGMDGERSAVEAGDHRYHAILGNRGDAKFVSASRFAPALIAWGARVRVVGPAPRQETWVPLEQFYVTPKRQGDSITVLEPGQFVSHVALPASQGVQSASYEVLQQRGLDWPQAAASVCVNVEGGLVREARIVLGAVAPVPWVSEHAAAAILGRRIDESTAERAAEAALADATPLPGNGYKVTQAKAAVKRALLRSVGAWTSES